MSVPRWMGYFWVGGVSGWMDGGGLGDSLWESG